MRLFVWLLAALACALLLGCGVDASSLRIPAWKLVGVPAPLARDVTLPAHLAVAPSIASYALETEVELPPELRGTPLTLSLTHLPAIAKLRANGRDAVLLDPDPMETYRRVGPQRFRIDGDTTRSGRLDLRLTVENTWTQSSFVDCVPELSRSELGTLRFVAIRGFNRALAYVALGTALLSGFSYLFVYLLDRTRVSYGLFGVEALTVAIFPAFHLSLTQRLLGTWEVVVMGPAICFTLYCALHFTRRQFGFGKPHVAWTIALLFACAISLVIHDPFLATQMLGATTTLFAAASIGQIIGLYVKVLWRGGARMMAWGGILCWASLVIFGSVDFAAWLCAGELAGGLRGANLGIAVIALFQAFLLSFEHMRSLARADRLAGDREDRIGELLRINLEVKSLNEELRRQVTARSTQLADAFARLSAAEQDPIAPQPGDLVDGRYRITAPLGEGGMGIVFEAVRVSDGQRLALKVLTGVGGATAMARFAREAQIAAQITHPNVVRVVDVDVAAAGYLYLVMELVTGSPMSAMRARFGDAEWALPLIERIAAGLAAIHELGVVHRDLKPSNVLIDETAPGGPLVKIVDFGIASLEVPKTGVAVHVPPSRRSAATLVETPTYLETPVPPPTGDTGSSPLTRAGVVMGTPRYMAPELARGARDARAASDVFSLGLLAFEMITGAFPFDTAPARLSEHADPPRARELPGGVVSDELRALVVAMLDLDPEKRPTAETVAAALRGAARAA